MDIEGKKLKAAREKAGLSQNALAVVSGVSRSYIRKLEADQANNPSEDKILALAEALEVKAEDLITGPAEGEILKTNNGQAYQVRAIGGRRKLVKV